MNQWKVILATMVIFACGVITGGMLTRTMAPKPEAALAAPISAPPATNTAGRPMAPPMFQIQRANFLRLLDKQLDLTSAQREDIAKIMKASQERTLPIWNQIAPQMGDELKHVREEIRGVLTPEQRKKFGEMSKRGRKADALPPGGGRPSRQSE